MVYSEKKRRTLPSEVRKQIFRLTRVGKKSDLANQVAGDRGELLHDEGDDVSESGGSLCTESSWDPEENDPLELEIERDEQVEQ